MPKDKNYRKNSRIFIVLIMVAALLGTALYATALENQVTNLSVTANPMRIGTTNYISFTLGLDSKVSINIYKETGEHVRTIWNGLSKTAGNYLQGWDGKDNNNILVTDGYYKIVVEAMDTVGAQVGLAEMTIKAAKAPTISGVTDTPDPFNPLNGEISTINYTLSNESAVTITIIKNYVTVRTLALNELKSAGANIATWDGKDNFGNLVSDGPVTYQIDAASAFEPTFKAQFKGTATVEKENPRITDFSLMPNPLKISSNSLTISYNLSEDAKVTLAIIDSTGATVRTILSAVSKKAGYNSSAWDGKNSTGAYVPEGIYSAVISAVDSANKSSGDLITTFNAGYHPAISNVSFSPSIFNPEDPATPSTTISYDISKDALVTVEIFNGYDKVKTIAASISQTAGTQNFTWDGRNDAGSIVGDADYTVQITATSAVVDTFFSTYKGTVTVEKGAPSITGVTLSPEPYKLGTNGNLSIMYSLSENSSVNINVNRGETLIRQVAVGQSKLAGFNSIVWNGKDDAGNNIPEGIYTVTIQGVDKSGNTGQAQGNVTCGYSPAISAVSHIPDVFNPPVDVSAAVYFTLSNDANVTLRIMNGFTPIRTIYAFPLTAGEQCITWDGKDDSGKSVADGPYTYQIDAVSPTVSTFNSSYKGTITVENGAPALTNLGVSPFTVKIGSNANFSYSVSEPGTITTQILKAPEGSLVRDLPIQTKTAGGYYTLPWDTRDNLGNLIATGTYILKMTVMDTFNNTSSAEFTFQAGAVPVFAYAAADPATIDLSTGISETLIRYNISEPSYITAKIFNSAGTISKTLISFTEVSAGDNTVLWDGQDSNGNVINDTFTFKIDATSKVGYFRADQASGTINIIGTPPVPPPSCNDCHTSYPASHPITNCAGCHSNNVPIGSVHTGTEDCASCHATHDVTPILTYECTYCHNETYSYKIPYHNADLNVLHTAPLTQDCSQCHDSILSVEHPLHQDAQGIAYDCNTCHQSTVTEVVTAITNGQKNCDACHTSSHDASVHTNTSFTTVPRDADMNCTLCHNSVVSEEHTSRQDAAGNNYTCDTCHGNTRTEVINAIANNNLNCEACHIDTATSQPTFHTSSGTPLHDSTYVLTPDVNCQQCHANNINSEHVGRVNSTTGAAMDCATCHSSSDPLVVMAITGKSTECTACHTYPTSKHQPAHTTNVYTTDTTRSDAGTCVTCHTTKNLTDLHVGKVNTAGATMDCNTCHASADANVITAITTGQTNSCESCHTLHAPKDATAVHDTTDVFAAFADTDCASCHDRNVKAEHIDKGRTINGVAMTCDSCHASADPQVINAINTNNTRCDACHTMPPATHQPGHTATVFTSDTARTDQATCSLCHVKVLPDQHVNQVTTAGITMDCNTCHSSNASTAVKTAVATANDNCEACHTVHPVKTALTQHDSTDVYAVNTDVNCASCHDRNLRAEHMDNPARTTLTGQPITCDTCHGSSNSIVQLAISTGNNKCDACHTYPTTKHQPAHTTNVYTTDTTRTDDCSMCHVQSLTDQHVGRVNSATGQAMDCNTCHASADANVVNAIATRQTTSCEACHTLHPVKDVTQLHDSVNFTNNTYTDPNMNCSTCHNSSVSAEHVNKTTEAGVTMNCDTCHKSTRTDVQQAIATNNLKCEACHTKVHTSPNPYHATTFVANPTMDCARCHNANSIADDHTQYKTSTGAAITCATCHNSTNSAVVNAIRTSNTGCDTCHTARHTDVQVPHTATYIPDTTWNCSNCHETTAIGYNLTGSYHKIPGVTPTTSLLHGSTFVSPWTATSDMSCRDCHNKNTSTNTYYGKLLKGAYTATTGRQGYSTANQLCFFCHSTSAYGPGSSRYASSGFNGDGGKNWHAISNHTEKGGCMSCHSMQPHSTSTKHLVVTRSTAEPNSLITSYTHETSYSKSNCTTSCH